MSRAKAEDTIVPEEMVTNPERFYTNVRKLALIVLHKHYSFVRDFDLQEDLIQEGICKAFELCKSGEFDSTKSTLRNYLYTGMRNQMQNHFYKSTKELPVPEFWAKEEYELEDEEPYQEIVVDVNEDFVYDVCDIFFEYGNYHNALIRKLQSYGVRGELTDMEEPEIIDDSILEACFILYVWRCKNG